MFCARGSDILLCNHAPSQSASALASVWAMWTSSRGGVVALDTASGAAGDPYRIQRGGAYGWEKPIFAHGSTARTSGSRPDGITSFCSMYSNPLSIRLKFAIALPLGFARIDK